MRSSPPPLHGALTGALICALGAGCMLQNLSATQRFNESAFMLNDSARWGRTDMARGHLDPAYRARYLQRHRLWGNALQIAEAEVISLQLDAEGDGATSRVQVTWYSTDAMRLRTSTLVQRWKTSGQDFLLVSETLSGDPRLFGPDPDTQTSKPKSDAVAQR